MFVTNQFSLLNIIVVSFMGVIDPFKWYQNFDLFITFYNPDQLNFFYFKFTPQPKTSHHTTPEKI